MICVLFAADAAAQINCETQPRECERAILSSQNYISTLEQSVEIERRGRLKAEQAQSKEAERADTEKRRADLLEKANATLESAYADQKAASQKFEELARLKDKEIAFQTNRANEFERKYQDQKKKTLTARLLAAGLAFGIYAVATK